MSDVGLNKRFLETTRGQILTLIRRGRQTVEELAVELDLTDNAVRNHLSILERDSLIQQAGVRRTNTAGKPALLYQVHPDAEPLFSRAYPSVLTTVVESLVASCPPEQADALLRSTGRRLAAQVGGRASGTFENRVRAAAAVLTALGGDVEVTGEDAALRISGSGCPLSATVSRQPELCRAVETLVAEVAGANATSYCEHGLRPRCRFAFDQD
jgi:predicted ArsR family transcriptional regulator